MHDPYEVVRTFEETIAEFAGSKYAVSVESCTAALFLSLELTVRDPSMYVQREAIHIPKNTYPSVPMAIIHAGAQPVFDGRWAGSVYSLAGLPNLIIDGALRFHRGMYAGGLHCLSFHAKKQLPIGRGGMILTDDADAVRWLKLARFDGREECALQDQKEWTVCGWNMYMTNEQAARGLVLFQALGGRDLPDLDPALQGYPDLSKFPIFTQGRQ